MTPDERRQRAAIDRVCQRMSDEYDRRQAERAARRCRLSWPLIAALIAAIAALVCRALIGGFAP
jgi:hypothetical protein